MKIILSRKANQLATAMLVVLVLGGILCLFVMSYLSLIQQQNTLSARSQAWNMAIAVTEAGIEEGLQALNSSGTPSSADGWSCSGTLYTRANSLGEGNSYTVSIDVANPNRPQIVARAYVTLPALAAGASSFFLAAAGVNTDGSCLVTRAVRVTCSKSAQSLFTAAMVSKHVIDLLGNGVASDSFDSSNPAKSTNGKYDPNKYQGDFGDVATNDGIIVDVQNANIYGKLHTGAGGNYDMGPNGGVGTHAWQAAHGGGMQPGYFLQDANFTFPDTTLPNTAGYLTPQPGDFVMTTYPVTSNSVTDATFPSPLPQGTITTNIVSYTTLPPPPSPPPPGRGCQAPGPHRWGRPPPHAHPPKPPSPGDC